MNDNIDTLINKFKSEFNYLKTKEDFLEVIGEELSARSKGEDYDYCFFEGISVKQIELMKAEILNRPVKQKVIIEEEW